jgi:hypothetical protein
VSFFGRRLNKRRERRAVGARAKNRAFYARADLYLVLSSPVAAWRLFAVRIRAIAMTIAVMALALAAPFINVLRAPSTWRVGRTCADLPG